MALFFSHKQCWSRVVFVGLISGLVSTATCVLAQDAQSAVQRLAVMGISPTPERLVQFAAQGDATVVNLLLQTGMAVDTSDPVRRATALHNAAAQGHLRLLKILLERGANVNAVDWRGNTPLINAAYFGQADAVKLLLEKGANIHAISKEGQTPLIAAKYRGKDALVAFLLSQGADASLVTPEGAAPLAVAEPTRQENKATILDYTPPARLASTPVYDPAFFGSSPVAEQQASRILQSWTSEPVTMPWTSFMLTMFVKHKLSPTRAARGSALVHVAMYDAWQLSKDDTTRAITVSTAAAQVLAYLFPEEEHGFDRIVGALVRHLQADAAVDAEQLKQSVQLGQQVGQRLIAKGEDDGAARGWNGIRLEWYGEGRYYGPGAWEPTAPYFYYPPNEPFAPTWKTWFWDVSRQPRPVPPAFGSSRFLKDLQEVVEIQKNLNPEQLRIAKFWLDGSGSVTPPGHWNQIAMDLVHKERLDERQTVKLFAVLNIALADTFIAAWDVKYYYWSSRPITMAKTVLGMDMKPAILTPPFPSYVSGHAAFSGASAKVISAFFPKQAPALKAMGEEAAMSRLFGGIHYRHDNEDGLVLGRSIADVVLEKMGR